MRPNPASNSSVKRPGTTRIPGHAHFPIGYQKKPFVVSDGSFVNLAFKEKEIGPTGILRIQVLFVAVRKSQSFIQVMRWEIGRESIHPNGLLAVFSGQ